MAVQVLVRSALVTPPLFVCCTGRKITIGRAADAAVRLPDPTVSATHAVLRKRGHEYVITDEGSTNGTALLSRGDAAPVYLASGSARVVPPGGRVLVGQVELELRMDGTAEGSPSEDLARDLVTASLASLDVELNEETIDLALQELTEAEDEPVVRPDEPDEPSSVAEDAGVVSEREERSLTDWLIAGFALAVLGASASALYWLLNQ